MKQGQVARDRKRAWYSAYWVLLVLLLLYPCFSALAQEQITVKSSMKVLQMGLEQYAVDHRGDYPACVKEPGFSWKIYVPSMPTNVWDDSQKGPALIADCIQVDKSPAYAVARIDTKPFPRPGMMRYYVAKDRQSYAITGSMRRVLSKGWFWDTVQALGISVDPDWKLVKPFVSTQTQTILDWQDPQRPNYTVHNLGDFG